MKKVLLLFILICLFLSNTFGQDRKHTVYLDVFPMGHGILSGGAGLGLRYDFNINQYFAIGGLANYFGNFQEVNTCNFSVLGKYFPIVTKIGSPYIDAGSGYRRRTSKVDDIHCLVGTAHTGFKFVFKNGLVLDPNIGFRYNLITFYGSENNMSSFNINVLIGWTF